MLSVYAGLYYIYKEMKNFIFYQVLVMLQTETSVFDESTSGTAYSA